MAKARLESVSWLSAHYFYLNLFIHNVYLYTPSPPAFPESNQTNLRQVGVKCTHSCPQGTSSTRESSEIKQSQGLWVWFFLISSHPSPILLFFFLSVFPLDYVEALGNLRDSRGFLVLPFFFLITNKERIRRHGPESVFMVVCDKVVKSQMNVSIFLKCPLTRFCNLEFKMSLNHTSTHQGSDQGKRLLPFTFCVGWT